MGSKKDLLVKLRFLPLCTSIWMLSLLAPVVRTQISTSSISGSVTDVSGSSMSAVTVTLTDKDTGVTRSNTTDSKGFYSFPGLGIGNYEVKGDKTGFTSAIKSGIYLNVNQQAAVNFALAPASVNSTINVSAAATALETASSTVSGLVGTQEIVTMPLNGRDYTQLALLQPGVSAMSTSGANPLATGGGIAKYSVNGIRPTGNNFLLDGQDINDPSFNVPLGGVSGQALGQDAIAEFSVMTSTYTAQYGRNAGAVINAVSKAGANAFHGSAYEFIRNSALDARNFFDRSIPPFKRNDFGGTLGGRIIKNKTFFFVNYEGLRERLGVTTVATVPDALARQGTIPVTNSATGAKTLTHTNVSPAISNLLNLYPLPNGPNNGDGTAQYFAFGNQPTNEDYVLGRVDHYFSEKDNLFVRYNFDNSNATVPFANTPVPGFPTALSRRNQFATIQQQHIFNPHVINSASASFTRIEYSSLAGTPTGQSISLIPRTEELGAISLSGPSGLGYSSSSNIGATSNIFDYAENLNWEKGRNVLKFGAEVKRLQINSFYNGQLLGTYNVGSLSNFLRGTSLSYQGVPVGSTSNRSWRQWATSFFAQDDFHVSQDLTLNFGLRYEYSTVPTDTHGRETNLRNPLTDSSISVGNPLYKNPTGLNFAPRVGFAWTPPVDNRKTVIRGGYGIFYDYIWENVYGNSRFTPPFFSILFTPNAPFPSPPSAGSGVVAPQIFTYSPRNPYSMQYNLNVERDLGHNFIFSVGFVGTKGEHLFRVVEGNPNVPQLLANGQSYFPATAIRINHNYGPVRDRLTDANSNYNGLQTSLNRQFANGIRLQISYTFAKSLDDSSGPFQTDTVSQPANTMDPYNTRLDYAPSAFDVRNVLVVNYTYALPFGPGKMFAHDVHGPLAKVIGGWSLNGIDTFETGHPFTVTEAANVSNSGESGTGIADRPNVTPGYSNNPVPGVSSGCAGVPGGTLGTPSLYFNPCAFSLQQAGFFGNVGRNTLYGPHSANFDLSLIKTTAINERLNLEFRAEFFNLFNHTNFQIPSNAGTSAGATSGGDFVFDASANRVGNAGKIFSTVTPSREIQFVAKFTF